MGLIPILIILILILVYASKEQFGVFRRKHSNDCKSLEIITLDSGIPGPCIGIISGVHGNEPAGSYTLIKMLQAGELRPSRGKLIVIPRANQCGLEKNIRMDPITKNDINRQFTEHGSDYKSKQIIEATKNCDLILDFHEGGGWHLDTKKKKQRNPFQPISLGSTLTPTEHPLTRRIAPIIIETLNKDILNPLHKFSILYGSSCDIPKTFACQSQNNGRAHILIETTGQKNVQPLAVREQQIRTILQTVMSIV